MSYNTETDILEGKITAKNLKPNFAYQVKLAGNPEEDSEVNEKIGLAGRWWREVWNGTEWTNGWNLNNKGSVSDPVLYPDRNPNDETYFATKDDLYPESETQLMYRYSGYLVFDYFITDSKGNTTIYFQVDNSYHVLWKTTQSHTYTSNDGPIKQTTFRVNSKKTKAYDINYPTTSVGIFGEWERLPVDGIYLTPGEYSCMFFLTEESFHGVDGTGSGNWAAAMGAPIAFEITE